MHPSLLIVLVLCCCFGGSSCESVETMDKALIRASKYKKILNADPMRDNGTAILSSNLVVDFQNMQALDFLKLHSYEKVMIAAVHTVLNKSNTLNYDQLIAVLNNVVLLKKPVDNGFLKEKDFWPPGKFWTVKKVISPNKLGRLAEWFRSLLDDAGIVNVTKFIKSKCLNLYEMSKVVIPYLTKECEKKPNGIASHEIINLTVLQYPTLENAQIKVYNIEVILRKVCSTQELTLHGKYQSHRFEAWKMVIKMMKKETRIKVRKAMKSWIEDEMIRRLFDDDYFIIENWYHGSDYSEED